ncbi:MAG: 4-hydroxy-tetrahydrodipicolinate reductase [Clostridiales bacterium]|nr:4-hydroxy-tetrahydrodipicolinate reductase [Clostridiales bacterium]
MVNIFLNGCCGRMGRAVSAMALESDEYTIVAGADIIDNNGFSYPIFRSVQECTVDFDVIVDFSTATGVPAVIDGALSKNKPLVCCTTALADTTVAMLNDASKTIPVFKSANMSVGMNVLIGLVKQAAKTLYPGYDIEILEEHHRRKLDAPSGTALMIADAINASVEDDLEYVFDRHSEKKARGDKEIGFSSIRGGNIVGEHEVYFISDEETVKISHSAKTRDAFARGALAAARFVKDRKPGLYSMDDVISGAFDKEEA